MKQPNSKAYYIHNSKISLILDMLSKDAIKDHIRFQNFEYRIYNAIELCSIFKHVLKQEIQSYGFITNERNCSKLEHKFISIILI